MFIAYGAPVRTVQQVMHDIKDTDTGFLRIRTVWPFPEKALARFKNARAFSVPEMNLGQIAREIERHVKVPVVSLPKLGGELHTPGRPELSAGGRPMTYEDWFRQAAPAYFLCRLRERDDHQLHARRCRPDGLEKRRDRLCLRYWLLIPGVPGYILTDSLHTTHGRAIAFATGVKMANPTLNVVVFTGDGDLAAIGGNHFIHACRRNIDITVVCMNNQIYGMTGGQGSPTTPMGCLSSTTPFGCVESPFDLSELAIAAGANYVSRWTSNHVKELEKAVKAGLETPGFSFIEALVQCPTAFGRRNKFKQVADQVEFLKTHSILKVKRDRILENRGRFRGHVCRWRTHAENPTGDGGKTMRHEVRFSGFGGQGIILSAVILGRATVMYDNKFAVQTQVYGPEARGGASMSAVIIEDEQILFPKVTIPTST